MPGSGTVRIIGWETTKVTVQEDRKGLFKRSNLSFEEVNQWDEKRRLVFIRKFTDYLHWIRSNDGA